MADNDLVAFRERWKRELQSKAEEVACAPSSSRDLPDQSSRRDLKETNELVKPEEGDGGRSEDQPEYVSITRSLLDGRSSPLLDRIQEERTRRKRLYQNMTSACSASLQCQRKVMKKKEEEELVDQLIQDLVGWQVMHVVVKQKHSVTCVFLAE